MIHATITPDHLPAIKWASQAFRVSDRQPEDGLYAILSGRNIVWVGLSRSRLLGSQIPAGGGLRTIMEHGLGEMHHFGHRKIPSEVEGEKPYPSEVDELKAVLADGDSVEISFDLPIAFGVEQLLHRVVDSASDYLRVDVPKRTDPGWKAEDGTARDLWVRGSFYDEGERVLAADLLTPFKGRTLQFAFEPVWWYDGKDGNFGLLAEKKYAGQETLGRTTEGEQ